METTFIPSPEYFLALFKDFPDAISVNRLSDGQCLVVNESFKALTGYSVAQAGGWISADDWRRLLNELKQAGQVNRLAITIRTRSGSHRQGQLFARCVQFQQILSVLVITSEVTRQQKLSETLRETETQLQIIFDNSAIGIAFIDPNLRMVRANRVLASLVGRRVEELIGLPMSVYTLPEDYTREEVLLLELMNGTRDQYRLEKRCVAKDGRVFWTDVVVSTVRGADGSLRYMVGMTTDIDDRKHAEESLQESEEKYRTVFAAENNAIFLIDPNNNSILDANTAACRLYGYDLKDLLGLSYLDISAEMKVAISELQTYSGPRPIHYHMKKNGDIFPAEISISWFKQQGRMVKLVTVRDITERQRVEEEREKLLQEVQQAHSQLQLLSAQLFQAQENERRNIAYDLHDEIGQLILAIKANLETVQIANEAAGLSDTLAASVNIVDTALEKIRSLALDLRPAMLDDFGLAATLEWYLERMSRTSRFQISFQSDLHDQRFDPAIETAGYRVAQTALMNIVRHSQAQHVHVTLGFIEEKRELEMVIRDNGIGFDVAKAFDQAQHGQSLGLLGLQERVRLVGGWSTIISTPGLGTEIRVRFPVQFRKGN